MDYSQSIVYLLEKSIVYPNKDNITTLFLLHVACMCPWPFSNICVQVCALIFSDFEYEDNSLKRNSLNKDGISHS